VDMIQINQQTCRQCGTCAATCGRKLIDFQVKNFPKPNALAELLCIKCGQCVVVCPTGSLTHREMPVEQCPPLQESLQITAEQCEYLLRSRRSVKVYKDQPVPRDVIVRLIEIARYAPTAHNRQEVEWLVVDNKEKLLHLEEMSLDWMRWMIKNQPELASLYHMEVMLKQAEIDKNRLLRGAPVLIVVHAPKDNLQSSTDCTIALTFLELAAKSLGLGCCWAGMVGIMANRFPPMKDEFPIPEGHMLCGFMLLGYPKFRFQRLPLRRPPHITWYRS
jgi:nitroreductase/formate hydrogenlyase subunit 6/NADH:ubiquinone oxidoreductase subunit I